MNYNKLNRDILHRLDDIANDYDLSFEIVLLDYIKRKEKYFNLYEKNFEDSKSRLYVKAYHDCEKYFRYNYEKREK